MYTVYGIKAGNKYELYSALRDCQNLYILLIYILYSCCCCYIYIYFLDLNSVKSSQSWLSFPAYLLDRRAAQPICCASRLSLSDWGLSGKRYFGQPPYIYIIYIYIYTCTFWIWIVSSPANRGWVFLLVCLTDGLHNQYAAPPGCHGWSNGCQALPSSRILLSSMTSLSENHVGNTIMFATPYVWWLKYHP